MSTPTNLLDEVLDSWYEVRKGLIREIQNIPPARFTFRPTLETRNVTELMQHVLEVAITTVEELLREDTNFHRVPYMQLLRSYAPNIHRADTQEKLIDLLVEQYKDASLRIRNAGELFMLQLVTKVDGGKATRFAMLQDAIAHESYHRGQMTVFVRLLGIVPALTRDQELPPLPTFSSQG
ncbi:MAG: hypothetical protein HY962_00735 [Ignavibacteriae bacterium]|nr:hypothetical protein [Ignavibacteriota bacterium]